ncbi:alkaline phosphatase D family protein [Nocardioides antri]|uniref:Alkaline phosphatase n=1 Tax=Nocardioides antri TaxID=2607659 RepID=A0A5B1LYL1_9ACTN|nr:alkaline phosphatase D family protein [Nocardioides antri]KAA1425661.1 alkaline phosphatase [Nocardioides antri]
MRSTRRSMLRAGVLTGAATVAVTGPIGFLDTRATAAAAPLRRDPFTLGVASGDPLPDGFVIWTRLAPSPLEPDGLGGMPSRSYEVLWQVATDERFTDVVRSGTATASPAWAHAVHVEVTGLKPGREYYYRFRQSAWTSGVGRSVTAPAPGAVVPSMTMAFASCSNLPAGYFTAYGALADERPDLVLHLGDYQYEGAGDGIGRHHAGPETVTLANYRQRHAQYKTDPDLQAAHAAAPWLVVWDDHEVDNNYADDLADRAVEQPGFLERRAAAYRAYYENLPLRRTSVLSGPDLQLFRRVHWGSLATFHMLDTRQYRSDQACGDGYKDCPEAADPSRSLLGSEQEQWLASGFAASEAGWDLLGQQVFFGRRDRDPEAATTVSMDAWDGYPATRQRVVRSWTDAGVRNPVVLTGDVHAHWASDVYADVADPTSPVVGSELITSSISSGGDGYDEPTGTHPWAAWNPNLRFWTNLRGYVSTTITPDALTARFRCVPKVSEPGAAAFTRATFVIEDGVRGLQAEGTSLRSRRTNDAPDRERIVRDTIREETKG